MDAKSTRNFCDLSNFVFFVSQIHAIGLPCVHTITGDLVPTSIPTIHTLTLTPRQDTLVAVTDSRCILSASLSEAAMKQVRKCVVNRKIDGFIFYDPLWIIGSYATPESMLVLKNSWRKYRHNFFLETLQPLDYEYEDGQVSVPSNLLTILHAVIILSEVKSIKMAVL